MFYWKIFFTLTILWMINNVLSGQINIIDPSFEGVLAIDTTSTEDWIRCEGTVDIWHANVWLDNPDPSEGEQYIGMVGGEENYFESVSQNLPDTLFYGVSYFFDFDLNYLFRPNESWLDEGRLNIYLGHSACDFSQKVALIIAEDTIWQRKRVYFTPESDYTSISFRQEYVDSIGFNYVLIDNCSNIENYDVLNNDSSIKKEIVVNSLVGINSFEIVLDSQFPNEFEINLMAIDGKILWRNILLERDTNIFNMSELPNGTYLVVVQDKSASFFKSFKVVNI